MRRPFLLALAVLLAPVAALADPAPVALNGTGGDAWTFRKPVEGSVAAGACEELVVTSPAGSVPAEREGDRFSAVVPLHAGVNEVRAVCRSGGAERAVATQRWDARLRDAPKARVRSTMAETGDEAGLVLDAGGSETAPGRPARILRTEWRAHPGNPALLELPAGAKRFTVQAPAVDGSYRVTLTVTDALGRSDESTALFRVRGGKAEAVDPGRAAPEWMDGAVVYGVVPFLFGPRGLADVTARLDAIAALGATAIWLSPINEAPEEDFGYAVTDHFRVRGRFGSDEDLRALVAAAHARGLKVLMDFVPNHLDERSHYHADAEARGEESPYFGYFDRDEEGEVTGYFDWTNLKNLNYDHPEVRRYMLEAFAHWVRDVGVDGFRVDASWAVRERAPEFWPQLRDELKRINPDLLLLAEASARDPWYVAHGFDAAYDWTDKLGQWAWHDAFGDGVPTAERIRAALAAGDPGTPVFRFLNNNDTGARFVTRFGVERTRVAATMLLTLPGVPCLYTGDEVGAAFEPYGAFKTVAWDDPNGFTAFYRRLVALRKEEPALRSRDMRMVETSHGDMVLAYERGDVLVALNYGAEPVEATFAGKGRYVDLLGGGTVEVDGRLALKGFGALVLKRADAQTAQR